MPCTESGVTLSSLRGSTGEHPEDGFRPLTPKIGDPKPTSPSLDPGFGEWIWWSRNTDIFSRGARLNSSVAFNYISPVVDERSSLQRGSDLHLC